MRFLSSLLSVVLSVLLVQDQARAQLPANQPVPSISLLQVKVLESAPGHNVSGSLDAQPLRVEVQDGNGTPVANAAVAVRLPEDGATGTFPDGLHSAVAYTDASGIAHFSPIQWGPTPGSATLRVSAAKSTAHAAVLLERTVTAASPSQAASPAYEQAPVKVPITEAQMRASISPALAGGSNAKSVKIQSSEHVRPKRSNPPSVTKTEEAEEDEDQAPQVAVSHPKPTPGSARIATLGDGSADSEVPLRLNGQDFSQAFASPAVSVVSDGRAASGHHGKLKWIVAAAAVAGAGLLATKMMNNHSSSTPTGLSIGSPSISLGRP